MLLLLTSEEKTSPSKFDTLSLMVEAASLSNVMITGSLISVTGSSDNIKSMVLSILSKNKLCTQNNYKKS